MKFLIPLLFFVSFSVQATCPAWNAEMENLHRFRSSDVERELWNCKLRSGEEYKRLEFCVGRMSPSKGSDYIGLGGIEQWNKENMIDVLLPTRSLWVSLDQDYNGKATDSTSEMTVVMTDPGNNYYRYSVKLDKRTGHASYMTEKKTKNCTFCRSQWKVNSSAELECNLE